MRNDEEMREFKEGCFSTGNLEWRLNLGIDISVSADIREYILNWSSLFQNEEDVDGNVIGAAFYIQALNDIMGDATLRIKADVALKDLDKWGIDAIIQLVKLKEPGTYAEGESDVEEEYLALYVLGSMHRDAQSYEESRLGLYLTMGAFQNYGITGIELNHQVFEEFLSLNLNAVLDSLGGTLSNAAGGIVNTLDDLIDQMYDMLGDEDKMKGENDDDSNEEVESGVQNAGEEASDEDNIYDYEEEVEEDSGMWFIGLLDSIQFTKGAISIVVAQTAIQTLLKETVGFPFDEKIGNLSVTLDNTANSLSLNLGLDYQEPIDVTKTEIANLNTTLASQESVDAVKNGLGAPSIALTGITASYNNIGTYSVFASEGYIGTSFNSEAYNVIPVGTNKEVGYLVYNTYDIYELDKNIAYGSEALRQRAIAVRTAIVNALVNAGLSSNNDIANDINILSDSTTKIAIKISENNVLLAYVLGDTSIPLNIAGIECSMLGDKLVSIVSEKAALEEIRATYESGFLVNAEIATDDGKKPLVAEKTYLQQQVITEDKDFPLENSGTRNVFYFVYNPSDYYAIDSAYLPGTTRYLEFAKANAEKVIESISDILHKSTYVWSQNAQGVHTFHHYAAMLNVSVKVAEVLDSFGNVADYKVLMAVSSTKSMYNVGVKIHGIDIGLGQTNIFAETPLGSMMREDYLEYFSTYFKPLSEYEMEAEVTLEFKIDDTVGGLFDMSELLGTVGGLLGPGIGEMISQINMALQPIDDIAISVQLALRLYIDFGSIEPFRLQLEMTYNDKTMALITYQGGYAVDEYGIYESSTIYVDLSGLGFPSLKLEGIQLGAVLRNLISGLGASDESTDAGSNAGANAGAEVQNVGAQNEGENANDNAGASGDAIEKQEIERVYLEDYGWTERLLLLTFGADETSLAITGALAYSLISNAFKNAAISSVLGGSQILIPMFRNLQIGYSEEDGVYGLCLRLTDDTPYEKAFRIGLNIGGSFDMWADSVLEAQGKTERDSSIDAREFVEGTGEDGIVYEDIGIINKVALNLELEARVRTKDSEEKPPQLIAVQNLLQDLLGLSADTINFDVQDTVLVFSLGLTVYADLADMSNTALALTINLTGEELIGVYFIGQVNTVYVNLSGLGLFQAALNGVDVLGILNNFLGGFLGEEGININEMLAGILTVEDEERAALNANNALSNASAQTEAVSLSDKAQNATIDLITATDSPLLKILMSNEEIIINPNMAIVQSLLGDSMALPALSDIRLSINLYQGLNNLNLRIKLDQKGNYLNVGVQEGNFAIALGATAEQYQKQISVGDESLYGGIEGLSLGMDSAGNLAANINALSLAQGLLDVISFSDFTLYIEKRNDYFFLRNLGYGGANGTLEISALGTSYSTGPTYFSPVIRNRANESTGGLTSYDHAFVSKGGAFDWVLSIPNTGINIDVGGLLKAYEPIFFDNAYRRIRLALNKTMTNKTEIPIAQLTQVANVQGSLSNEEDWEPQGLTAFLKNNVLHLSLANILVIDLSGLINTVCRLVARNHSRSYQWNCRTGSRNSLGFRRSVRFYLDSRYDR